MFDPYEKDDRPYLEELLNPEIVPIEEQLTIIENLNDLSIDTEDEK